MNKPGSYSTKRCLNPWNNLKYLSKQQRTIKDVNPYNKISWKWKTLDLCNKLRLFQRLKAIINIGFTIIPLRTVIPSICIHLCDVYNYLIFNSFSGYWRWKKPNLLLYEIINVYFLKSWFLAFSIYIVIINSQYIFWNEKNIKAIK